MFIITRQIAVKASNAHFTFKNAEEFAMWMPLKNSQIPCVEIEYFLTNYLCLLPHVSKYTVPLNVTCQVVHFHRADKINQSDIVSK